MSLGQVVVAEGFDGIVEAYRRGPRIGFVLRHLMQGQGRFWKLGSCIARICVNSLDLPAVAFSVKLDLDEGQACGCQRVENERLVERVVLARFRKCCRRAVFVQRIGGPWRVLRTNPQLIR
jgi:hypothetical protein